MPISSASAAASASSCVRVFAVAVGAQQPPVLVSRVGDPRARAHAAVELQRVLEVVARALAVAERGGEHAEVAIGGAVAGDEVADHHVRAGQRLQLAVDQRGDGLVAGDRARVGQVGQRGQPQRERYGSSPSAAIRCELAAAPRAACRARPAGRRAPAATASRPGAGGEHPDHRRQLGQAPLLALDAEHLDPVRARRVAAGQQLAPLLGAQRPLLGLGEPAAGERERGAVLLGDVHDERLAGALGQPVQHRSLALGRRRARSARPAR